MQSENVILVNAEDQEIGSTEKMAAHRQGLLHRAISVFIFDEQGRLLLQRRAAHKYHSANLWTNTCCSHPAPGEGAMEAAHRRLREEMGMKAELSFAFTFQYRAAFDNGLIEHEVDHVFIGHSNRPPIPNPEEVADFRWLSQPDTTHDVNTNPEAYTPWFKLIYERVFEMC